MNSTTSKYLIERIRSATRAHNCRAEKLRNSLMTPYERELRKQVKATERRLSKARHRCERIIQGVKNKVGREHQLVVERVMLHDQEGALKLLKRFESKRFGVKS